MYVLRCTKKLLRRLGSPQSQDDTAPTTALGDWYANLFNVGHSRMVHLVSDRSLLSVLVPARNIRDLAPRHTDALAELLWHIGIQPQLIEAEAAELNQWTIGPTRSRSVLASMRDLAINARWRVHVQPGYRPIDLALELAGVPCGPLQMRYPAEVAVSLLTNRYAEPAQSSVPPNNSLEPTRDRGRKWERG